MFTLKSYQVSALECLEDFLTECTQKAVDKAFVEYAERMQIQRAKYHDVFNGQPCVCLRIPTGGGKTIIGAAAIKKIDDSYCQTGAPIVLWLTPSDAITTQTLKALKDNQHPYRLALEKDFPGAIVTDVEGVETLTTSDLGEKCVVVVSTIQTFNIDNTNQRCVYGHNEALEPFFADIPEDVDALEKIQETDIKEENGVLTRRNIGKIKFSLANLLALYKPIIIVDEAHNNRTERFFRTLNRLSPSVVLELTATPIKSVNNVIYQVSAWELKAADMIKLPIVLRGYDSSWENCLLESVNQRNLLERKASDDEDYIRPILLIQAMQKGQSPSPEEVKTYLTETLKIPAVQIAIATGSQKDLDGVDLFDQKTPIRYVITIKALKEGWDCSFAYVLCSLQNIHSAKDVEQLLGRIMRMPYAKKRAVPDLNRAYADVVSTSTYVAANLLRDNIVEQLGFDQMAAAEIIEQVEEKTGEETLGGLFAPVPETQPHTVVSAGDDLEDEIKKAGLSNTVKVTALPDDPENKKTDGEKKIVLTVKATINTEDMDKLKQVIHKVSTTKTVKENEQAVDQVVQDLARHSSKKLQLEFPNFNVPRLCYRDGDDVRPVDDKVPSTWNPLSYSKNIIFQPRESVTEMVLDVEEKSKRIQYEENKETSLTQALIAVEYTEIDLIKSLMAEIKRPDVKPTDLSRFVADVVRNKLMGEQKFDLLTLVRNRVALKNAFKALLEQNFKEAVKEGYQQQLDLACADVESRYVFPFDPDRYEATRPYDSSRGGRIFKKHYYPVIDDLTYKLLSGRTTEEYFCADAIETNCHVKTWVRNIPRGQYSFHLPLSNGHKFFPDFVAMLDDGRILVIEYKGEALKTNDDSKEKRDIGELWEKHSNGKGLFLFATYKDDNGRDVYQQIADKISGCY